MITDQTTERTEKEPILCVLKKTLADGLSHIHFVRCKLRRKPNALISDPEFSRMGQEKHSLKGKAQEREQMKRKAEVFGCLGREASCVFV